MQHGPFKTERQVILLLDVIEAVKNQVFMHHHRISIYRPIIHSFVREGLARRDIMARCMGRDHAFDAALRAGALDIVDPKKMAIEAKRKET